MHPTIQWSDFEKVELRVGTIVEVLEFPKARKPAWRLRVDFGPEIGIKQSSAQIKQHYSKAELVGRQVVGVVNFAPKQIGPVRLRCSSPGFTMQTDTSCLRCPSARCRTARSFCDLIHYFAVRCEQAANPFTGSPRTHVVGLIDCIPTSAMSMFRELTPGSALVYCSHFSSCKRGDPQLQHAQRVRHLRSPFARAAGVLLGSRPL
jgi:tRNA-binding protein